MITLEVEPKSAHPKDPVKFSGSVTGPAGILPARATVDLVICAGNNITAVPLKTFEETVLRSYSFSYAFENPGTFCAQATATKILDVEKSGTVVIEVQYPTGTVGGYVIDAATSQGISGAIVVVEGMSIGVETDASGRYEMEVPAGAQTLIASKSGYKNVEQSQTVTEGSTHRLDFRLSPTQVKVIGYVKNAQTGNPVSGATVRIGDVQSYSDSTGYYEIPGLTPGTYTASVSASSYETRTESVTVAAGTNRKDFTLTPVTTTDPVTGQPVPVAGTIYGMVTVETTGKPAGKASIILDGKTTTTADSNGNYRVDVEPGTHKIHAELYVWTDTYYYDYFRSDEATVNMPSGGSIRQDFVVKYVGTYGASICIDKLRETGMSFSDFKRYFGGSRYSITPLSRVFFRGFG